MTGVCGEIAPTPTGRQPCFLSKGQWTYGPAYRLSIDTHIRLRRYKVMIVQYFYMKYILERV